MTILLLEQKRLFTQKVADKFFIIERGRGVVTENMEELNADMVKRYLTV